MSHNSYTSTHQQGSTIVWCSRVHSGHCRLLSKYLCDYWLSTKKPTGFAEKTKRERERDVLQYVFLNELIMVWDFTFNLHLYRLQACTCTLLVLMSLDMLVPVAKSLTTSLPHTQLTSSPAGEEKQRQTNKMFLGVFVWVYKTAKKEIQ